MNEYHMTSVAVIDVETTGIHAKRGNRIVEVAALIIQLDGTPLREFVTLINPERDIGPTHVHGLNTSDILNAPRFIDIAGALIKVLDGCVALVGHNIRFDLSFISNEYSRLGYSLPDCPTICTMNLTGGRSLPCACVDYNIALNAHHAAFHDAQATASLFMLLLNNVPDLKSNILRWRPIAWPSVPKRATRLVSRVNSSKSREQRTYQTRTIKSEKITAKRVCFTGESQCKLNGEIITREMATKIAARQGFTVLGSVTKSLELLIVADPLTQSTKAKRAHKYGIRIMHEPVFWHALGLEVD